MCAIQGGGGKGGPPVTVNLNRLDFTLLAQRSPGAQAAVPQVATSESMVALLDAMLLAPGDAGLVQRRFAPTFNAAADGVPTLAIDFGALGTSMLGRWPNLVASPFAAANALLDIQPPTAAGRTAYSDPFAAFLQACREDPAGTRNKLAGIMAREGHDWRMIGSIAKGLMDGAREFDARQRALLRFESIWNKPGELTGGTAELLDLAMMADWAELFADDVYWFRSDHVDPELWRDRREAVMGEYFRRSGGAQDVSSAQLMNDYQLAIEMRSFGVAQDLARLMEGFNPDPAVVTAESINAQGKYLLATLLRISDNSMHWGPAATMRELVRAKPWFDSQPLRVAILPAMSTMWKQAAGGGHVFDTKGYGDLVQFMYDFTTHYARARFGAIGLKFHAGRLAVRFDAHQRRATADMRRAGVEDDVKRRRARSQGLAQRVLGDAAFPGAIHPVMRLWAYGRVTESLSRWMPGEPMPGIFMRVMEQGDPLSDAYVERDVLAPPALTAETLAAWDTQYVEPLRTFYADGDLQLLSSAHAALAGLETGSLQEAEIAVVRGAHHLMGTVLRDWTALSEPDVNWYATEMEMNR